MAPRGHFILFRKLTDDFFHFQGHRGDLSNILTMEISSVLHRCLSMHPPQHLHDVYLQSLRQPEENTDGQITSNGDAFEFIMDMFRYTVFFFKFLFKGFHWLCCLWRTAIHSTPYRNEAFSL